MNYGVSYKLYTKQVNLVLTNNLRKIVASLGEVKYRRRYGLFKAEGTKCVLDTIGAFNLKYIFATDQWLSAHPDITGVSIVKPSDLHIMSSLTTPSDVIAVFELPEYNFDTAELSRQLVIALDGVQDPGNLGTIIRTADWFGIHTILCNYGTADAFNPKVIQSTMGAISRVKIIYLNLADFIRDKYHGEVFGTFLDGDSIFTSKLPEAGMIIMGNEGNGISNEIMHLVNRRIHIPSFPPGAHTSESLNVAIATAIVTAQFRAGCVFNPM